jgi:hypothetical protein
MDYRFIKAITGGREPAPVKPDWVSSIDSNLERRVG